MGKSTLLHKIIDEVSLLYRMKHYVMVNRLVITVNPNSKLNEKILFNKLKKKDNSVFGPWTEIIIKNDNNLGEETAIINDIVGEKGDV